jgi:hypothetical protein
VIFAPAGEAGIVIVIDRAGKSMNRWNHFLKRQLTTQQAASLRHVPSPEPATIGIRKSADAWIIFAA